MYILNTHLEMQLAHFSHCAQYLKAHLELKSPRCVSQDANFVVSSCSKLEGSFGYLLIHTVGSECAMLMPSSNTV